MHENLRSAPPVSVAPAVHNGGEQFCRCLHSLATCRYQFAELIIVDDCSTDGIAFLVEPVGTRILRLASRKGPATARNRGALAASGDILLFLDSDVCPHSGAIARIRRCFENDSELSALFGSYDTLPCATQFVSQFRNPLQCLVHRISREHASTFRSGSGAIRRNIFLQSAGFDASYSLPGLEDIELGSRLARAGVHILLGMSWTRLILASGEMPNVLNLRYTSRASVALTGLLTGLCGVTAAGILPFRYAPGLLLISLLIYALNLPFFKFLNQHRGIMFAAGCIPLHLLYFFCGGTGFVLGVGGRSYSQLSLKLGFTHPEPKAAPLLGDGRV